VAQNEALIKENKLHKNDLEAMENRLLEKEKLISMLILQRGDREKDGLNSKHRWEINKDEREKEADRGREKDKVKRSKINCNN
jgi:hypothetical protein